MRNFSRETIKGRKLSRILSNSKGLTLVELLAVITILGIVAGIATPTVQGVIAKAKEETCYVNAAQLESMYETQLVIDGVEHTEALFSQFMVGFSGISYEDGEFQYVDGKVQCSRYPDDKEGEVPHL
ncbi:type II secretion system protein [Cytobacillus sp. FJAT-53684]|uniref:Type II secretion system protein n=1 Tax=Cytobacillus mangrovibacter TaxID=3299024 RepID=A0ABW6K566_9BACI